MIHRILATILVASAFGAAVPAAGVPLPQIPRGVTVGGVAVGGLTFEPARAKVEARFDEPIRVFHNDKVWHASPASLGANATIQDAIVRAVDAKRGQRIKLRVDVDRAAVRRFVARLDRKYHRPAVDAKLIGLSNLAPSFTEAKPGQQVARKTLLRQLVQALRSTWRGAQIALPLERIQPKVTSSTYGPIVVIRRGSNRLALYKGHSLVRAFGVATGQAKYPTPLGTFEIVSMQRHPWWLPPDSDWAKDEKPIPPGPGTPLGTRWMGLTAPGVGIHATPDAASIGYSASHGCIRMRIPDAEALFTSVDTGTPVFIVSA
ncbi:MAG TPA: L,D-transpeptidase family protein [Gaiellaceae bacterium]|nr:L,D-transpeptidase family protein [Gaiellaceae bacterium]